MLNWMLIREELDAAPWREEDGEFRRSIFIGTAAHIYPSGKIYRPWALEEVACSRCLKTFKDCSKRKPCIPSFDGESLHCNYCRDEKFNKELLKQVWKRKLYLTCAAEDGFELYIGEVKPIIELNDAEIKS